jgi:hypothetical protein
MMRLFWVLLVGGVLVVVGGEKITLVRESFDEDHELDKDHTKFRTKDLTALEAGNKEKLVYTQDSVSPIFSSRDSYSNDMGAAGGGGSRRFRARNRDSGARRG